jgi:apolipoprotein N-acyltransferase
MANMSLPPEERNLTPAQVDALDVRRRRGTVLLTIAGMFTVIAVLLTCWVGQDLQYAPGFSRPMTYYFLVACGIVSGCLLAGLYMRRGAPEVP